MTLYTASSQAFRMSCRASPEPQRGFSWHTGWYGIPSASSLFRKRGDEGLWGWPSISSPGAGSTHPPRKWSTTHTGQPGVQCTALHFGWLLSCQWLPLVFIKGDIWKRFLYLAELAKGGAEVWHSPTLSTWIHVWTMTSVLNPQIIQHLKSLPASINADVVTEVFKVWAPRPRGRNVASWRISIAYIGRQVGTAGNNELQTQKTNKSKWRAKDWAGEETDDCNWESVLKWHKRGLDKEE